MSSKENSSNIEKVNLAEKLSLFKDYWQPRLVGEVNNMHVKLVKLHGPFEWHHHETEDELFFVIHGSLTMRFRDRDIQIEAGEFLIVPHGVEHMPVANEEVHVMLLEPNTTLNTGTEQTDRTAKAEWI